MDDFVGVKIYRRRAVAGWQLALSVKAENATVRFPSVAFGTLSSC